MWNRIREPWLIVRSVVILLFSGAMSVVFVSDLGWRYTDWVGLSDQTFDASGSFVAYAVFGAVIWPIIFLILGVAGSELLRSQRRRLRRAAVRRHF